MKATHHTIKTTEAGKTIASKLSFDYGVSQAYITELALIELAKRETIQLPVRNRARGKITASSRNRSKSSVSPVLDCATA